MNDGSRLGDLEAEELLAAGIGGERDLDEFVGRLVGGFEFRDGPRLPVAERVAGLDGVVAVRPAEEAERAAGDGGLPRSAAGKRR